MSRTQRDVRALGMAVNRLLNGEEPPARFGFMLLVAPFDDSDVPQVHFIGNVTQTAATAMIAELLHRWAPPVQ